MDRRSVFPRSLQYLIAIAEHGSYTRAAEALYVSQPTLSQQIKQLEESLDTPLLDRSGRTVRLTDAGEVYVRHARRAWGELDAGTRAIHDVKNLSRGRLRLGWTPITDYLTCRLLERFNHRHPGITLSTLEMPQDDIETAVTEGTIDIGITFSKPLEATVHSSELVAHRLFEETLCVAVGAEHPHAGKRSQMKAQEVNKESLALLNTNFALRHHIDQYCLEQNITPRIAIDTNSLNVIIELIQVGRLATILPESIVKSQCGLYSIKLTPELPIKAITVISRQDGYQSPAYLAFMELASEWSRHRLNETPMERLKVCPLSQEYRKEMR